MNETQIGSSFDDFLREQDIYEEIREAALRRVVAWQLKTQMEANGISRAELARRMETSRSQVDRILDGNDPGISPDILERAAKVIRRSPWHVIQWT